MTTEQVEVKPVLKDDLGSGSMPFYTMPPKGVDWPYLLCNPRNVGELSRRLFRGAIFDAGVEYFHKNPSARDYPPFFLHGVVAVASRLPSNCWVTIPDYPDDYHPGQGSIEKTVANIKVCLKIKGVAWLPVVQSRNLDLLSLYEGLDATKKVIGNYPRVALGTVCKTNKKRYIVESCKAIRDWFPKSHIHAFGLTLTALPAINKIIDSWDSMAWTFPRGKGGHSCKNQRERVNYFHQYIERIHELVKVPKN